MPTANGHMTKRRSEARWMIRDKISAQKHIAALNELDAYLAEALNAQRAARQAQLAALEQGEYDKAIELNKAFLISAEELAAVREKANINLRMLNKVLPDLRPEQPKVEHGDDTNPDFTMVIDGAALVEQQPKRVNGNGRANGNGNGAAH